MKVELDLSSYATKSYWCRSYIDIEVTTLDFAKRTDLAHLKYDVNKLDIDKLKTYTKRFKKFEK